MQESQSLFNKEIQAMHERDIVTPVVHALSGLYHPQITRKVTVDGININGMFYKFDNWLHHLGETVNIQPVEMLNSLFIYKYYGSLFTGSPSID